jgi:hypothetical protein
LLPLDHPPPRLIAPLSGSLASTAQPQLRWELATGTDGAAVDVCRDRACQNIILTLSATGNAGSTPAPLPAGHVFWRARGAVAGAAGTTASPVWELFIPHRVSTPSTALATRADFDGDGYTDFVLEGRVLRGGATGYVGSIAIPAGPTNATLEAYILAGDINGDGYGDLLRIDQTPLGTVGLWTPVPLFGSPTGFTAGTANTGSGPTGALYVTRPAGDINGDGYADVVFKSRFDLQTWQGSPTGLVSGPVPFVATSQGYFASDGDVNGDGFSDAASNSNGELGFDVTSGSPAGFSTVQSVPLPTEPFVGQIQVLDANADGFSDVALATFAGLEIFAGSATGVATVPFATIVGNNPTPVGAADFNGDGQPDLVVNIGNNLEVHYGHGGRPDAAGMPLSTSTTPFADPASGAFGDVNGDGYDDLTVGVLALDPTDQRYHVRSAVLHLGGPMGLDPTGTPAQ